MKKDTITYEDFSKLDLIVGEIKEVEPVEKSEKLLLLSVDLGEAYGTVTIMAGIAQKYGRDDLIGNKYMFLANLESRKMMGQESQGMLIAANDNGEAVLIEAPSDLAVGTALC